MHCIQIFTAQKYIDKIIKQLFVVHIKRFDIITRDKVSSFLFSLICNDIMNTSFNLVVLEFSKQCIRTSSLKPNVNYAPSGHESIASSRGINCGNASELIGSRGQICSQNQFAIHCRRADDYLVPVYDI